MYAILLENQKFYLRELLIQNNNDNNGLILELNLMKIKKIN